MLTVWLFLSPEFSAVWITAPTIDSWNLLNWTWEFWQAGCPLRVLVGGCRISGSSGRRREDRDGCGEIAECFKCTQQGQRGSRQWRLKVASLKHVFYFHTFHASPVLGVQDSHPWPAVLFSSVLETEAAGVGKQTREICSDATIAECLNSTCTSVLLYCHWRKTWLGGKTAHFQGSFLRGKLLKNK